MIVAILAAGYGTRLRPLTEEIPKPLLPIGDAPMLEHLLSKFAHELPRASVGINASHLAEQIDAFRTSTAFPFSCVLEDSAPRGTAGGIRGIREAFDRPKNTLVWNGDILSEVDAGILVQSHRASDLATLFVIPRAKGEGNVGLLEDGRIVRLRKSSFGEETRGGDFVGIHVVGKEIELPQEGCIVGDVYIPLLDRGARLVARELGADFSDIGSLGAYLAANMAWLGDRESWVHETARVSAKMQHVVVGAGATVEGRLENCVVLPGAKFSGTLEGGVVTARGIVARVSAH